MPCKRRKTTTAKKAATPLRTSGRSRRPTQRLVERERSRSPLEHHAPPSPSPSEGQSVVLEELHLPAGWSPQTNTLTAATGDGSGSQARGMGQAENLLAGQPGGGLAGVHRRIDSILDLLHQVVPNNTQLSSSIAHQPQGATAQHLIAPSVGYPPPTSTYIPPRSHVGLPLPPSATITSTSQLIAEAQPAVNTTFQLGYTPGEDPRSHTRVLGVTTDDDIVKKIRRGAFIELGVLSKSAPSPSASSTYNLTLVPPPPLNSSSPPPSLSGWISSWFL